MAERKCTGWAALIIPLLLAWLMIIFLANRVGDLSRRLDALEFERSIQR